MLITNPSYIIGAGPNGVPYYHHPDGFTLALNGAAIHLPWSARMLGDANCYRYDYFYEPNAKLTIAPRCVNHLADIVLDEYVEACTVAGIAIEWLVNSGCMHIILIGVDMAGGHWNGTDSGQVGVWRQLPKLQSLVDFYRAGDIKIESFSKTSLVL